MKNKLIALVAAIIMLFQVILPVLAIEKPIGATETNPVVTYVQSSAYRSSKYYTQLTSLTLTGNQRTDIVNIAKSQIGYHEGNNSFELDGSNSSGNQNYSEAGYWFGTEVKQQGYGHFYDWCAMFVAWCARQAGISTDVISNAAYAAPSNTAYRFKNLTVHERDGYIPETGDLIFFDHDGNYDSWDHVGIVESVDENYVYTIEGNSDNMVAQRMYALNDAEIRAYGVPEYDDSTTKGTMTLDQLKAKFPAGKYWNHVGSSTNNPDGVTDTPCPSHNNCDYNGNCGCNSFDNSIQCLGFVKKLAYDAYGIHWSSFEKITNADTAMNSLKPGDVIRYKNDGHSIFVTGVDGETVTYADCNGQVSSGKLCIIQWDKTTTKSAIKSTFTALRSAPYALYTGNRPQNLTVSATPAVVKLGQSVTISFYADYATYYYANIYYGNDRFDFETGGNSYVFTPTIIGNHTVFVSAWNSLGGTDVVQTTFTVVDPAPGKPIIHVNPGTTIASTVIWWYACENTHHYDLRIYNEDGSLYDAYYNINDIYKRLNLPSGRYTADVVACTTSDGPYAWSERSDAFDVIDYFSGRIGQSIIYNGHTYMMLGEHAASWYEAELICEKLGGHLATITSSGEQEAIYNMIKSSGYTSIWWWLGATDAENEGTWKWVTGEPFTYSNWAVGEPCNDPYAIDGEDYAHMYGYDGTWNDVNIIQFNPNILLELDYANDNYPGQPVYTATYNNHTYSIYSHVLLNWHDAESFCEKHGGTLATVTSQEEYNVITDLINQAEFGFVWLGATDEKQEGKWEWVTGEPFEYTNWLQGQPDNYGNSEHYMNTYVNANENKWNDTSENSLCYFILETVNTHTVTFKDGVTGNTISTAQVEHGKDATFPAVPVHDGYTFTGWDKDGKNITSDTIITALYKQDEVPTPTPTATPTPTPTPTSIPSNAPQAVTESKTTQAGQTVTVTVNMRNNPGFMYMRAVPVYDSSVMTLTAVANGIYPSTTVNLSNPSYIWEADQNITGDGVLLTLTFTLKEDAEAGAYAVGISVKECYNYDEDDVTIYAVNGTITVTDILYGDCNGDGVVDGKDLVRLRKYLSQYDDETGTSPIEISAGADCNGDGKIDGKDLVRLRKYLSQYDDDTGTSPIHLGPEN